MRKSVLLFAALAALAFGVGGLSAKWRAAREEAAAPPPAVEVKAEPVLSGTSGPPAAAPAVVAAAAPPAPKDPDADLPVMAVAEPPVHPVPADAAAEMAPTVTYASAVPAPQPPPPAPAGGGETKVERMAALPPPPPPAKPRPASAIRRAVAPVAPPFAGKAKAIDGASLTVDGRAVRLFGVRAADPHDRCGDQNCGAAARAALAQRLAGNSGVSCAMPPGQEGDPAYVCHDSTGVDLGRLLVIEGLALADTSRSYEYLAAQDDARIAHHGLWRYR